jgi:hydroxypyruvate reductase
MGESELHERLHACAEIDVIAAGKAAGPMLTAFAASCGLQPRRLMGIGPNDDATLPEGAKWYRAAHPIPDERSVRAGHAALDVAKTTAEEDGLVVLLSGGASALMAVPSEAISLTEKQRTIQTLLDEGADISEVNTVRKHVSAIKGGRLAVASRAAVITLALSDVPGDAIEVIASGPTVPDPTTAGDALRVLGHRGGTHSYPSRLVEWLERAGESADLESPKPGDPRFAHALARVIGGADSALDAAHETAAALGYNVTRLKNRVGGEARVAARRYADATTGILETASRPLCLLSAGETTVHVRGTGRGGRNQEFALALAEPISRFAGKVVFASVGTDGIDGPTDAAGAVVDDHTIARALTAGLGRPEYYLANNDSYTFFDRLGDLIRIGPTNTNVADIQIMLAL